MCLIMIMFEKIMIILLLFLQHHVNMAMFVSKEIADTMILVVLKCVLMVHGVQYVMITGTMMMLV